MAGVAKVTFNGETWIDVTDKTVTANKMLTTGTALSRSGDDITGSITSNSSSDVTASGKTVTVPAGYYSSAVSKSVATGSAGTPTAAKGSVTVVDGYRSMSVTPSVTNTTGYITGGTKTGTAVTVSASELVSGNKAITSNGTGIDVANYSTVSVNVEEVNNQNKTVSATTSQQSITADSGYSGLGTVTIRAVTNSNLSEANIKDGVVVKVGDSADDDRIANITGTFTDSSSVSSGQTAATKDEILNGYSAWVDGAEVKGEINTITLSAPESTNNGGTKIGSNIGRSTSTRYINIPQGYNESDKYYQISSVSNLTLPTATSDNHTGYNTLKATINPSNSIQYLNIPVGYNTTGSYYTISALNNQNKTVTPSTSQQSITADEGYTGLGTVVVSALTPISLPIGTSDTSLGAKKATISRASTTKYLNIGTGYNDTASYYEVPGITNMVKGMVERNPPGALEDTIGRSTNTRYLTLSEGYNPDAIYYTISAVPDGTVTAPSAILGMSPSKHTSGGKLVLRETISVTPSVTTEGYVTEGMAGNSIVSLISDINVNSASSLTASGDTVTVPAGYYASDTSKSINTGSVTVPSSVNAGQATIGALHPQSPLLSVIATPTITPTVTTAGYIEEGTAGECSVISSIAVNPIRSMTTVYPSTSPQQVLSPGVTAVDQNAGITVEPVTTSGISAENIKHGTTIKVGDSADDDRIAGVTGTFTKASTVSSGQTAATANKILSGYSAWVDGAEVKGSIATKTSSDLTTSGATVTVPAGYYASSASASVTSMTLPTSTSPSNNGGTLKATVGRNALDRYINIPSGYNSADAYYKISAVPDGQATVPNITGTSASVTAGTNTLTLSKTISATPTVNAGYIGSGTARNASISLTASVPTQGATTITPSSSSQTAVSAGTYCTDDITVDAIPGGYIIPTGDIAITSSGTTDVSSYATATVAAGTVTAPSSISGTGATLSTSVGKLTLTKTVSVTPNVTTAGYISSGTAGNASVSLSANVISKSAATFYPSTSQQSIAANTYLTGAQTIEPVVTQGISAGNIKDGAVVKVGDDTNNARITSVTGTFTDASTVSSGQTAATASQILSGYSAWVDGAEVQGSIATMTLPTAPTTTSSGTKIGSNIGRSTSTRYLNIPAGYNSTAQYYQISAVANMTLPTATSTSSSGTAKLTITPGASNKYLNIPTGYNGTASYYTISPGMTFETGTWTPTADIARGTISFASTHSTMPLYVCVFDQTQTTHATGSPSYMLYMDEYQIFGATFPSNTNFRYGCITSLFKTDSGTNTYTGTLQYPSTDTGNSSTAYPRYWVTESEFYPYSGSTARYWRSGRTYKWLAVWKAQ